VIIGVGSRGELGRPKLTPQGCYARFSSFLQGREWAGLDPSVGG
jgi:hypothetical protein